MPIRNTLKTKIFTFENFWKIAKRTTKIQIRIFLFLGFWKLGIEILKFAKRTTKN